MDAAVVRSNIRSVAGLAGVALVLLVVVRLVHHDAAGPSPAWQPPAGYVVTDTVPLTDDHSLRLWTSPTGWYVESLSAGRSESAVGAASGGDQFAVTEILDGFVGNVPVAGTRAVSIRQPGGDAVRAAVHDGIFVLPAHVTGSTDSDLLITPVDATGMPLAAETSVPITGRP